MVARKPGAPDGRTDLEDRDDRARQFRILIGNLVRGRRNELGVTQGALAKDLGVSQQQIVKYEKGIGRIPADNLSRICAFLKLDPSALLYPLASVDEARGFADAGSAPYLADAFADRDTVALVRAFQSIDDKRLRKQALRIVETMAQTPAPPRAKRVR